MRYFRTSNASRQYKTGGLVFTFEPVDHVGGVWLGVLAVGEPAATTLANAGIHQIKEISEQEFEAQKKKGAEAAKLLQGIAGAAAVAQPVNGNCGSCGRHPYGVSKGI